MNYWQFKFKMNMWEEFDTIKEGDLNINLIKENIKPKERIGDIIFWYRTDNINKIYAISEIASDPFVTEIDNLGKAHYMKMIKILDKPFDLDKHGFKVLKKTINKKYQAGTRYLFTEKDNTLKDGDRLYKKLMLDKKKPKTNIVKIDEKAIAKTILNLNDIYSKYEEDGKNGKYYNIFLEANIASQEIRHSSFLANLLKKDGNHFQDTLFLEGFIKELQLCYNFKDLDVVKYINIDNCRVDTEEFNKTEKDKGLFDIIIDDGKYAIVIENKTGTVDHKNQLVKYDKFLNENYDFKDYIILYLTANGEIATDKDSHEIKSIYPISYINHISSFIGTVLKENTLPKNINDILSQYKEAIVLNAKNLNIDWKADLDILNKVVSNKKLFKDFELLCELVNKNILDEYLIFQKNNNKTNAVYFSKYLLESYGYLEVRFFNKLNIKLNTDLENLNYIVVDDIGQFKMNDQISIFKDIQMTTKARTMRSENSPKNNTDEISLIYNKSIDNIYTVELKIYNSKYGFIIEVCLIEKSNYLKKQVNLSIENDLYEKMLLISENFKEYDDIVGMYCFIDNQNLLHHSEINKIIDTEYMKKSICDIHKFVLNIANKF